MASTREEISRLLEKRANELAEDWHHPMVTYVPEGDCLEFLIRPCSFVAERLDDRVTVYCEHKTGEIVGSLIKNFSEFAQTIREKHGFAIFIHDGKARLSHVFMAHFMSTEQPIPAVIYSRVRQLVHVAEESKAELELVG